MLENEGQPTQELEQSSQTEAEPSQEQSIQDILDLDSVEKVKFQGREWTPSELRSAMLMQADYTRKTQELSSKNKYWDALDADLSAIRQNPALKDDFLRIYPKEFHKYADFIKSMSSGSPEAPKAQTNPELETLRNELNGIKNSFYEQNLKAVEQEINSKFDMLTKKYPLADEEYVIAKAESLLARKASQGEKQVLSDSEWDALWKSEHTKIDKLIKEKSSNTFRGQKEASNRARSVGVGGGIPTRSATQPRTLKEATALALKELE